MPVFIKIPPLKGEVRKDSGDNFDFKFAPAEPNETREHILLATRPEDDEAASLLLPAVQQVREGPRSTTRKETEGEDQGFPAGDSDGDGTVAMGDFLF